MLYQVITSWQCANYYLFIYSSVNRLRTEAQQYIDTPKVLRLNGMNLQVDHRDTGLLLEEAKDPDVVLMRIAPESLHSGSASLADCKPVAIPISQFMAMPELSTWHAVDHVLNPLPEAQPVPAYLHLLPRTSNPCASPGKSLAPINRGYTHGQTQERFSR